jgi:hypothetical protein
MTKHDGRFEKASNLAIHDLPLPALAGRESLGVEASRAAWQCDRLVMVLVADLLRLELAALDGTGDLPPHMRPHPRLVAKRCALGLRVLRPAMMRLGLDADGDLVDTIATARVLCAKVANEQTDEERRMLAVTMLTVSTTHDERLFVRVLQCYETTFALVTVRLQAAIIAARACDAVRATRALRLAEQAMREAKPLSSLLATMKPRALMSAIPVMRERVLAGRATLQDAMVRCPDRTGEVLEAMGAFEASVHDAVQTRRVSRDSSFHPARVM